MFSAFQSNAFQNNAFQIVVSTSGPSPTPTPSPAPGPGDMHGDQPSWEWLHFIEEQKRLDEERGRRQAEAEQVRAHKQPPAVIEAAPLKAQSIRHILLETEARARHMESIEQAKAEKALLDEMIIVGILSI